MLLQTKDITKRFGNFEAVKGVSLDINPGQVVGLLGPNGAGKSTTISMMATLAKPTTGDILFKGQSVLQNPKTAQKKLGIVPQNIALYKDLSGFENLKYWGSVYGLSGSQLKNRIEAVSEIIGISDRLKDPVKHYSGGMQRRINIGAALLHEPELLIMDEPTVGIDPQSRNHILSTVKRLNEQGMSILYTSHYMEEVEYLCEYVYIMDMGKVIAQGSQHDLVAQVADHQTLSIRLEEGALLNEALLKAVAGVLYIQLEGELLTIKAEKSSAVVSRVLEALTKQELALASFEVQKPNLESVFLKLTGKALRD